MLLSRSPILLQRILDGAHHLLLLLIEHLKLLVLHPGYINGVSLTEYVTIEMLADSYYKLTFASTIRDTYGAFGFIRMSLVGTGDNLIVTVGEPIE